MAKDATSFDTLVDRQVDRQVDHRDGRKAERADRHAKAEKPEREKTGRDPADDSDAAVETDGRDTAQAARTPEAADEKPRAQASLDGETPGTAQEPGDMADDAAALQASATQMGQAAQAADQKTQTQNAQAQNAQAALDRQALAALAGTAAAPPKDAAAMEAAGKKTNGVQAHGQPSEQRSDLDVLPGGKPVALNGQEQQQDDAQTGTQADAQTGTKAGPQAKADAKPDGKDAGIQTLMDTARTEKMPDAAPQPQAPATNMAASGLVRLDTAAPAQTATPTQHVQVTAQAAAAPDLPRLAVDIAARSQGGAKQFDIRLDPPELGRVEVRLSIDHDGKTSAHLTAEQPRTLDLLQRDSVLLARALRDAGLDVSQDNLNFSLRQQAQEGGHNLAGHQGQGQGRGSRTLSLAASRTIEATATSAAWRGPSDGRLDIRV